MELDDELCLCFHVTKRKVINYLRVERPDRPSQLAECFGAGTGCGWCRPYLRRLFEASRHAILDANGEPTESELDRDAFPDRARYARLREGYRATRDSVDDDRRS
ncbi:MAG: (2Fe-2S)-binding protein [Planctomycetes bacterium]|nr:(2Fe-2S)-binding protein [Planctomycetota bacterium]